jgi:2-hydroxycyclohexanecarboxyl-CoA dehydrogenase
MDLKGQKALVMGALGTCGSAVAREFAEEGAAVMLSARRMEAGEQHAEALRRQGYQVVAQFGRLDILANCFSVDLLKKFVEDTEDRWDTMIDVNFKAFLYGWHAALQHMVAQKYGRIISLVSDSGKIGATMEVVQSGTKAAVIASSKSLAREVARDNITVNVVCVGPTRSPEQKEPVEGVSQRGLDAFLRLIPFRRFAEPEEVAAVACFLATREASFVTGQAISASGGLTMC